jgi:ADP-heptose:LPS heptosyltransferase
VLICSGRPEEKDPVTTLAATMNPRPLVSAGNLTFRQMSALIARAALVISGDTGPMHVAAAVNTPYLALFGPTPVDGRAPLTAIGKCIAHDVPCGPCDQKTCGNIGEKFMLCMRLITVDEVLDAANRLTSTTQLSQSGVVRKSTVS